MMAQGELLRGDTFARPCDFYTISPLREVKKAAASPQSLAPCFEFPLMPAAATVQRAWTNSFSVTLDCFVFGAANRDRESRGRAAVQ